MRSCFVEEAHKTCYCRSLKAKISSEVFRDIQVCMVVSGTMKPACRIPDKLANPLLYADGAGTES